MNNYLLLSTLFFQLKFFMINWVLYNTNKSDFSKIYYLNKYYIIIIPR